MRGPLFAGTPRVRPVSTPEHAVTPPAVPPTPIKTFGTHDDATLRQIADVASRAERAALMADGHVGYVMPIGGVAAYRDQVSVVGVGVDIGCGNAAIRTDRTLADLGGDPEEVHARLETVADAIAASVDFGMGRRNRAEDAPVDHPLFDDPAWDAVPAKERGKLKGKAREQLGTVGGGNHYVDVLADESGTLWVGVHFGSRGFGYTVATSFLALGQGKKWGERAPEREVLLGLRAPLGHDYWHLMNLAGRYAYAGREWVARKVVRLLGATEMELVHNHHNFCVPSDALVATPDGPKRMRDVAAGDVVYAFDERRGLVTSQVTKQQQTGIRPTVVIRTRNRRVAVTDDHPVLVVDVHAEPHPTRPWHQRRVGRYRWKTAGAVVPGDILVCAERYFAGDAEMGIDKARVVGAMLGDGWIRHEPSVQGNTVGLAIGDARAEHTTRYRALLETLLPSARWHSNVAGAYGLTCSSVDVWKEVVALGLGAYSKEKRVPRATFRMPRHEKLALLAGYVDADGSVAGDGTSNHGRATLASTNRALTEDLRELAIGAGLRITPIREEHVETNFGPATSYRCVLSADSTAELDLWHDTKRTHRRNTIHRRRQGLEPANLGYLSLPDGLFGQRVLDVRHAVVAEPVYDLSVDHPSHAFVCDGVVIHNCWRETHDGEELMVIRKGATPAFPGQKGFVGGSMGDDAVIVQGALGTSGDVAESQRAALYSTVHGAGRVMSRTAAAGKRDRRTGRVLTPGRVTSDEMHAWLRAKGVILRGGGLDESPQAYRRLPEVLAAQEGTVEVLHTLRPLVVVMAGPDEFDPYKD